MITLTICGLRQHALTGSQFAIHPALKICPLALQHVWEVFWSISLFSCLFFLITFLKYINLSMSQLMDLLYKDCTHLHLKL